MNGTKPILLLVVMFLLLLQTSCKEKSTEPPPPQKNPREYTWTIDTLAYPGSFQTMMTDVWGSSPTDVYVVGHNDQGLGLMWRFDGMKWTDVKLVAAQGGKIDEAINLAAVFGTASNNIWAIGMTLDINPHPPPFFVDSSLIIHFNGLWWEEQRIERGGPLWSISGSDAREVWTCGSGGIIYHYDGTSWMRDSVPLPVVAGGRQSLWNIKVRSRTEAFAIGVSPNAPGDIRYYFFMRKSERWSVVNSFSFQPGQTENRFGIYGLWLSPQGTLYSFDSDVFRWTGSAWINVYQKSSALRRMAGTSDNNFFVVGDFGEVLHYNGVDWFEYTQLKNTNAVYSSVWTDGKEVFIVGYLNDGSKTLILHGK